REALGLGRLSRIASGARTIGPVARFTVMGIAVGSLIAGASIWGIDTYLTNVMIGLVAQRAADQANLAVLNHVNPVDFEPPYPEAKLDELGARLRPSLTPLYENRSGVVRVNIMARDGTIIFSHASELRGQVLSPDDKSML